MDESTSARVSAGVGGIPESAAKGDVAEVARADIGVHASVSAGAVVSVRCEAVAADPREVIEDRAVAGAGVRAEPCGVAG